LHLFQYDPDDANSSGGQRLIKKSHFFVGKEIRTSTLVKMQTKVSEESVPSEELVPLCGADDGSLSVVLPLSESSYRALFVMQEQIIDKEEHNACLNPRMYRNLGMSIAQERSLSRFLLDYSILGKFCTLNVQKKYNYSRKLGIKGEAQVWDNLGILGQALNYL
jgi:cleavage and polyadenylation specificity factor subunit 1